MSEAMKTGPAKNPAPTRCAAANPAKTNRRAARAARPRRAIARAAALGLLLAAAGCANAIDVICPPAGQCPNVRSGHGGGY